uniref:Protein kinase domain-containing protein n=1 Tax=Macrostomum lignano TaxID=282301 RepID=A0A1I8JQB7_9PLAT
RPSALVDCGGTPEACRIIVKPYKLQNNSAVSDCNDKQMVGRFVLTASFECPESGTGIGTGMSWIAAPASKLQQHRPSADWPLLSPAHGTLAPICHLSRRALATLAASPAARLLKSRSANSSAPRPSGPLSAGTLLPLLWPPSAAALRPLPALMAARICALLAACCVALCGLSAAALPPLTAAVCAPSWRSAASGHMLARCCWPPLCSSLPLFDLLLHCYAILTSITSSVQQWLCCRHCRLLLSLPALLLSPVSAAVTAQQQQRCNIGALWRTCKRDYGAKDLFDGGYNFGWQPFNLLRQMCQMRPLGQCTDKMDFTHIMILSVYNYNLYARAADYICERHNVGIFERHAECLWLFCGRRPATCSRLQKRHVNYRGGERQNWRGPINDTKHNTQTIRTDMETRFSGFLLGVRWRSSCAISELRRTRAASRPTSLPNPIVMLVVKYYSQLMPDWCRRRSYEPLADLMADQRVQRQAGAASSEDASPRQVGAPSPAYSAAAPGA